MKTEEGKERCSYKPRLLGAPRGWGRGAGQTLPQSHQKEPSLPTP